MNASNMNAVDMTERKRLMSLLREPAASRYQDGMNLYEFVKSDPNEFVDSTGLYTGDANWSKRIAGAWRAGIGPSSDAGNRLADLAIEIKNRIRHNLLKKCPKLTPSDVDNISEAARHMAWQALITNQYGAQTADALGDVNERYNASGGTDPDSQRDYQNNVVGRDIGGRVSVKLPDMYLENPTDDDWRDPQLSLSAEGKVRDQIAYMVQQAIEDGKAAQLGGGNFKLKCDCK